MGKDAKRIIIYIFICLYAPRMGAKKIKEDTAIKDQQSYALSSKEQTKKRDSILMYLKKSVHGKHFESMS